VLHVWRRDTPLLGDREGLAWRGFVRTAFARGRPEARRTFRNALSNLQWRRLSADLAIPAGAARADLTLDQWPGLYRFIAARTPPHRRARALGGG